MAVLTPAQLAEKLNSDPRSTRKFLRSITPKENHPGKGSRWVIDSSTVPALRKQFKVWDEARQAKAAEAETAPAES
jgi:hypothetical protein